MWVLVLMPFQTFFFCLFCFWSSNFAVSAHTVAGIHCLLLALKGFVSVDSMGQPCSTHLNSKAGSNTDAHSQICASIPNGKSSLYTHVFLIQAREQRCLFGDSNQDRFYLVMFLLTKYEKSRVNLSFKARGFNRSWV